VASTAYFGIIMSHDQKVTLYLTFASVYNVRRCMYASLLVERII